MSRALALALSLACPLMVLAQETHEAVPHEEVGALPTFKQGLVTGITAIVVFLIVLTILRVKVWPVIAKALDERADKIKGEIESAEMARKQAKDALDQYQKSLAEARSEAKRMLDETKAQQQALAADLKVKADAELAVMKDRARRDIEAAKRAAVAEIYAEAGQVGTLVASKILRREVTGGDQQRVVEESIRELQGRKN